MIRNARLETMAGICLILGMALVCGVIILLSEVPGFMKPAYDLAVIFPDASGILKGSDVSLSGALIGKVASDPRPVFDTQKVEVHLRISQNVRIRQGAQFTIESSGLLGDRFIAVRPVVNQPGETKAPYLKDGAVVNGTQAPDLSTLMTESLPLIHRANHVADQLDDMITRLNTNVLDDAGTKNLKAIVVELPILGSDSHRLIKNAKGLIAQVKSGKGAIGVLFYDKQARADLKAFIANLKAHGPVFYSDDTAGPERNLRSRSPWRARP